MYFSENAAKILPRKNGLVGKFLEDELLMIIPSLVHAVRFFIILCKWMAVATRSPCLIPFLGWYRSQIPVSGVAQRL